MKAVYLALGLSALAFTSAVGQQTTAETNAANATHTVPGASARDGFTLRGTEAVLTRNGITSKLDREVVLPNGLRVLPNGNVTLRDGSSTALRGNQLLTLEGTFQDVLLTPEGVAPLSSATHGEAPKPTSAPTSRDGIHIVGKEVLMTRNGVTEKVNSDVRLPNGVSIKPSGIVVLSNGNTVTLRPDQFLDLNGVLRDAPARPAPRGK